MVDSNALKSDMTWKAEVFRDNATEPPPGSHYLLLVNLQTKALGLFTAALVLLNSRFSLFKGFLHSKSLAY